LKNLSLKRLLPGTTSPAISIKGNPVCSEVFYDQLSPLYHFLYQDWEASIIRQANTLDGVIRQVWGDRVKTVLDVACGIGTQAIGLAALGYEVTASDLSPQAVERARREAAQRHLDIHCSVADMRQASTHHQRQFDVVIACDNAVPHLLSDAELVKAFRQFYRCTAPGGGCLISVRDYATMERSGTQVHSYDVRAVGDMRYILFQVWEFDGPIYDLALYCVEDIGGAECHTQVMRSQYYAIGIDRLIGLMDDAGFASVHRIDDRFFQPLIVGTR
jgi:SAM-dependent methyltransferase